VAEEREGGQVMTIDERMERLTERHEALLEAQIETNKSVNTLAVTVTKYVDAADARMRRIEENLDGLIRAITSEHTNGKGRK
jgi:hypothetical protein